MANLKIDLLNKANNDKYFKELELVRLAADPNMNYEQKIGDMSKILKKIAILNAVIGGVEQYFKEEPQPQGQPQQIQSNVHQGQTHGE